MSYVNTDHSNWHPSTEVYTSAGHKDILSHVFTHVLPFCPLLPLLQSCFHSKARHFRTVNHSAKPASLHCFLWAFRLTSPVTQRKAANSQKSLVRPALWPSTRPFCSARGTARECTAFKHNPLLSSHGKGCTNTRSHKPPCTYMVPGWAANANHIARVASTWQITELCLELKFKGFTQSVTTYAKTSLWKVKVFSPKLHTLQQISSLWMLWGSFLCCQNIQSAGLHY